MTRVARHLFLLGALALLALPASAQADPLSDCLPDNKLDRGYSNSQLRKALDDLPTDSDEYGSCREILAGAIHDGSDRGGRSSSTGPGGKPLAADEQDRRARDREDVEAIAGGGGDGSPPSVEVGGRTVTPGADGTFDVASASNDLPVPLLLALIALAMLALTGVLVALRSRVAWLARVPLLSKIPTPRAPFPRSTRR